MVISTTVIKWTEIVQEKHLTTRLFVISRCSTFINYKAVIKCFNTLNDPLITTVMALPYLPFVTVRYISFNITSLHKKKNRQTF